MAGYPTYTLNDVATASGYSVDDYVDNSAFVDEALVQATLLFQISTCRNDATSFPDDTYSAGIARYGILALADAIYWAQPWQKVLRSPFSSETIGSYSYSKLSAAVSAGLPTGVSWFDIATGKLSQCDIIGGPMHGGYNVFDEPENLTPPAGYTTVQGPADIHQVTLWADGDLL